MASRDEQPRIAINYRNNKAKALNSLLGMISGLVADRRLNKAEVLTFDTWLREQSFLKSDPDVFDILDLTGDILSDGIVTSEELEDLKTLLKDVLEYKEFPEYTDKAETNHLLGVIRGIAADGVLNKQEIISLRTSIRRSEDAKNIWPFNILHSRIDDILDDGIITNEEKVDLLKFLDSFVGGDIAEGVVDGMAMTLPLEITDRIDFDGLRFCMTGGFIYGPRKVVAKEITKRGGLVGDHVTKKLNYLVVGSLASADWAYGSYGRKIERAMSLKDGGQKLYIIGEELLVSAFT